jgi:hypothetical protein
VRLHTNRGLTPAQHRGRIGGLTLSASRDPREYTGRAREAFLARFEREVDPEGALRPEERVRRATARRKAYFSVLAQRSAATRARRSSRRGGRRAPDAGAA